MKLQTSSFSDFCRLCGIRTVDYLAGSPDISGRRIWICVRCQSEAEGALRDRRERRERVRAGEPGGGCV